MDSALTWGFWAAAAYNVVGILVFSHGLTNGVLFAADPLFGLGGCIGVILWGLAYAAQSRTWRQAPAVSAVFALEKVFYAGWWAAWLAEHGATLPALAAQSASAAAFYSVYGLGDAAFAVVFAAAAWRARSPAEAA